MINRTMYNVKHMCIYYALYTCHVHVHVEKKYKPQVFCLTSNPTNIKIYRHVQKHRLRVHVCVHVHVQYISSRKTCI